MNFPDWKEKKKRPKSTTLGNSVGSLLKQLLSTVAEVPVYFPLLATQHGAPRATLCSAHQFQQERELTGPGIG